MSGLLLQVFLFAGPNRSLNPRGQLALKGRGGGASGLWGISVSGTGAPRVLQLRVSGFRAVGVLSFKVDSFFSLAHAAGIVSSVEDAMNR